MTKKSTKKESTPAPVLTVADLLKEGGEFDTRLKETRSIAWEGSAHQLHQQLGRNLASLQRNHTTASFGPPSEDAMLRYCLYSRAKTEMHDSLFGEAQAAYQRQPDDYDIVLGDLVPEEFRQQADAELAQKAYLANTSATADEDWGVFLEMRKNMGREGLSGLPTGLPKLDEKLGGLRGLTFVGADKGVGKTSLVLGMALAALKAREDLAVLIYSLDMSKTRIYERLTCSEAGLDYRTLFGGIELSEQDQKANDEAHRHLRGDLLSRLRVVERDFSFEERSRYDDNENYKPVRKGLTSAGILTDCRNLMAASGTRDVLVIIDLFQKMDPRGEIADSAARDHYRLDVLDQVRKASCYPSRPHGYTIVVISEIRKDAAKGNIDRDDLKGDGRMASDADVVMLMWPDKNAGSTTGDIIPTTLRIDKGREGVIRGDVTLWFHHTCSRFYDAAPTGTGQDFDHDNKIQPGRGHTTIDPLAE
jgi:replicative DNA helicase